MLLVFLEGFNRRTPSAYIVLVFSRLKFPHGVTLCSARPMSVMAAAENKSAGLSGTFLRNMDFIECWVYAILKEQLPEVFICYDNIPCEQQE
ncbi:hypothetical protein LWI28_007989 [Acer negundo]|uniref:Uncharacterized protein n=1 Tax=Acer negundo TaxID=4023 RepID=A0AAD5IDQ8_ACENE|nr:hypothetical protein LWI28_007989 [Acer negundo]